MFYDKQPKKQQEEYKHILAIIGSLSNLFSESTKPALYYRAHENCFCKCFEAINLARHDCSADATKNKIGIGLKTWVGSNTQKVAEFGKLKNELDKLSDDELVVRVSEYRNDRINTTMNMYGLDEMVYHVVVRTEGKMNIDECEFDKIDIDLLKRIPERDGENTRYFTDKKHIYSFNKAKTTLYMEFDNRVHLDEVDVNILDDPFELLETMMPNMERFNEKIKLFDNPKGSQRRRLALKLFKETEEGGIVEEKSGLNIWNAKGRVRHPDEVYIPFNKKDRERIENQGFFPPRDKSFDLLLPDGKHISAKVCQEEGKAIMSNPNKDLGKWLLRDVLELPEYTLITYELLQSKGFDTVVFEKIDDEHYMIDFADSSIYDELYNEKDNAE